MPIPKLFVAFVVARIFAALLMAWIYYAMPTNRYEAKSPRGYTQSLVRR